jgi:hypothetical protein
MSAYPSLTHDVSSSRRPRSGLKVDVAEDGTPRARTLYSATVYDFTIVHPYQSSTNRNLVTAHYAANANGSFSYTWPDGSVAHTCVYAEAPEIEWHPGGWTVRVQLVGTVT